MGGRNEVGRRTEKATRCRQDDVYSAVTRRLKQPRETGLSRI